MKQIHRQRLARLALALLDAHFGEAGAPRFNMREFRTLNGVGASPHACATSCCFLGYAPDAFAEDPSFQRMLTRLPHVPAGGVPPDLWCTVSE